MNNLLSPREREVLGLILLGFVSSHIARLLGLHIKTVETHRATIHRKLNTHNVAQLARFAAAHPELVAHGYVKRVHAPTPPPTADRRPALVAFTPGTQTGEERRILLPVVSRESGNRVAEA